MVLPSGGATAHKSNPCEWGDFALAAGSKWQGESDVGFMSSYAFADMHFELTLNESLTLPLFFMTQKAKGAHAFGSYPSYKKHC